MEQGVAAGGARRFVVALVVAGLLGWSPAAADDDASALAVEVPFGGSRSGEVPQGWTIGECPRGAPPRLVVVTCEHGAVLFEAKGYEPDQGPQDVTVVAAVHGAEQVLTYTVSLAAPAVHGPPGGLYGFPLGQGVGVTIPFSELVAHCEGCTDTGPTYTDAQVEPADAGTAAFTATGLALRPAPGFTGAATISFRVRVPFGRESAPTTLGVGVVPGRSHAPTTGPHLSWVEQGEVAAGDVLVDDRAEDGYPSMLASCRQPLNGSVACDADGSFVYTPRDGFVGIDQFAYHLTEQTGDHAVGSVVVVVGADPSTALDVRERAEVRSPSTPPRPLTAKEQTRAAGVFPVLRDALAEIEERAE